MKYVRMPIEIESPEQVGYENIRCNLTESSVSDAILGDLAIDLQKLVICYGDHVGHPGLRALIASDANQTSPGQAPLAASDILLTAGAATALFIVATALLEPGDGVVVMRPNYATNIETPRAIGADVHYLDLRFENRWQLGQDGLAQLDRLLAGNIRLVSLTAPHNPTGTTLSPAELDQIVALCATRRCPLLIDETYRDLSFATPLPVAATLSPQVISVSSLSKAYGLPGIRLGWLICRDPALQQLFLAAKEQIMVTGSVVDEEIGFRFLQQRPKYLPAIQQRIAHHFQLVRDWMADQPGLEWVEPSGGVICFPRIRPGYDSEKFYRFLNDQYGTFVGPGHWFEQERRFFRLGYGWPTTALLQDGLAAITAALAQSRS